LILLSCIASGACPAAALAAPPEDAAPTPEPPVVIAVVAGVATALVPLVIGGVHTATASTTDNGARNVGYAVAGVGPALSPIVAHAVVGEYVRGLAFGAPTVALEIALSTYMAAYPSGVFDGTVGSRTAFGLMFAADIFGAGFGIVDVMMARERWLARGKRARANVGPLRELRLLPRVGFGQAGLALGGSL
jgi:hypothetical protein